MTAWTSATAEVRELTQLEGVDTSGRIQAKVLARTATMLVVEVEMARGARSAAHAHPCDSAGVVVIGQLRATVGGLEFELGPGDGYHHPEGVEHHVEAVTDCRFIEIKSPAVEPW